MRRTKKSILRKNYPFSTMDKLVPKFRKVVLVSSQLQFRFNLFIFEIFMCTANLSTNTGANLASFRIYTVNFILVVMRLNTKSDKNS